MAHFHNNALIGAGGQGAGAYQIDRSLRFDQTATSHLNRTPSTSGNKKKWTWSGWVKRCTNGNRDGLFEGEANGNYTLLRIRDDNDKISLDQSGGGNFYVYTNAIFRDNSAWYHIVCAVDTTQSTDSNRVKIYVNGVQQTLTAGTNWPSQDQDTRFNDSSYAMRIGGVNGGTQFDGYMAEVHFVDGAALAASDFGEYDDNNVWQPKEFTGSYNQGGSGTIYSNDLTTNTGSFASGSPATNAFDGDTGQATRANAELSSNNYVEFAPSTPISFTNGVYVRCYAANGYNITNYYSVDLDGNGLGSETTFTGGGSGFNDVAWIQVATGSGTLYKVRIRITRGNSDSTSAGITAIAINGTSSSNILVDGTPAGANGFYLKFADNSSNAALGTDSSGNSNTFTVNNISAQAATYATAGTHSGKAGISFNGTNAVINLSADADVNPGSGIFTLECYAYALSGGSAAFGIYDGSPGGNGSFVLRRVGAGTLMVERHNTAFDITGAAFSENTWHHVAVTRDSNNNVRLFVDGNQSGSTSTNNTHNYQGTFRLGRDNNGFTNGYISNLRLIKGICLYTSNFTAPTGNLTNASGTKLLMAQSTTSATAATVKPSGVTISGPGDGSVIDSLIDTPTNYTADSGNNGGNYATFNLLNHNTHSAYYTLSNGNLKCVAVGGSSKSSGSRGFCVSTLGMSSGKYYFELTVDLDDNNDHAVGIATAAGTGYYSTAGNWTYAASGSKFANSGSAVSYGASYGDGDTIGVAFDADTGALVFYKNGSSQGTLATVTAGETYFFVWGMDAGTAQDYEVTANFGQRPFAYTPPSGYVSLCTQNLADPTIADGSTAFEAKLYTGTGSTQTISGLNFSPDLVWIKRRSGSTDHNINDIVRGAGKQLASNQNYAESTNTNNFAAFTSDGFTVGTGSQTNAANPPETHVAWAWDAGSSNTSVTAGSLNSSAYNTSDKWSDDVAGNTYGGAGMPKSKLFNGAIDNNVIANSGTTLTFSPSGLSSISTLRMYGSSYTRNANGIVVNGTDYTSYFPQGGNSVAAWVTIPETSLTSVAWSTTGSGLENGSLFAIEVDGKLLVDNDQTPPNVPSNASTVRANPSAGISIVTYTGTGTGNTVAHGLNAIPEMIILKGRNFADNWRVYHKYLDASEPEDYYLMLESTNGKSADQNASFMNNTPPTSSVFSLGTDSAINGSSRTMVAYCFAPVAGFSEFGSYTGNGSASGPFIFTGFRPKWILFKMSSGTGDWRLMDTSRDPSNPCITQLYPNNRDAEIASNGAHNVDYLSNGFKVTTSHPAMNSSSQTYLYAAFAEHPFKTARAR